MIQKANIQWSGKQLYNMNKNGKLSFDNYIQRSFVWDAEKKSLLIHSMLVGYPIPAFFAAKGEKYDMLDGKQRSNAIISFIENEYALVSIPEVDGEDLNGKTFEQLTEEQQDRIKDYSLTIYYFDKIEESEIDELFFRLNNGKPLSAIEIRKARTKSRDALKRLSEHPIFTATMKEKALVTNKHIDVISKVFITLFSKEPCYSDKVVTNYMVNNEITKKQEDAINYVLTLILSTYNEIKESNPEIAKKIVTPIHLESLVRIANKSCVDELVDFVKSFYGTKDKAASNNIWYNDYSVNGTASKKAVETRLKAIDEAFTDMFPPVDNTIDGTETADKIIEDIEQLDINSVLEEMGSEEELAVAV